MTRSSGVIHVENDSFEQRIQVENDSFELSDSGSKMIHMNENDSFE